MAGRRHIGRKKRGEGQSTSSLDFEKSRFPPKADPGPDSACEARPIALSKWGETDPFQGSRDPFHVYPERTSAHGNSFYSSL
jgi:hypothetical protein